MVAQGTISAQTEPLYRIWLCVCVTSTEIKFTLERGWLPVGYHAQSFCNFLNGASKISQIRKVAFHPIIIYYCDTIGHLDGMCEQGLKAVYSQNQGSEKIKFI